MRDGEPVRLTPKAFDLLLVLVEERGRTVEKDELFAKVWPGTVVEENNLNQNITALRKSLERQSSGEPVHRDDTGTWVPVCGGCSDG